MVGNLKNGAASANAEDATSSKPVNAGNRQHVEELYAESAGIALSKVMNLVGQRNVAEEIVQDAFVKLWGCEIEFPSKKAAYAWIYRVSHNAGIDYLRSHNYKANRSGVDASEEFEMPGAFDQGERLLNRDMVSRILSQLSQKEAQILCYSIIDGMGQQEIAELLQTNRKAIYRTLLKINTKVKKMEL